MISADDLVDYIDVLFDLVYVWYGYVVVEGFVVWVVFCYRLFGEIFGIVRIWFVFVLFMCCMM